MIYIDTGAFIARYIANDQFHVQATSQWTNSRNSKLYTSNVVIDETLTLLSRRAGGEFANKKGHSIYASPLFTILRPDKKDEIAALEYLLKYADQSISYTDCISFTLMQKFRIETVFGFDKHFELAKFKLL